jgi:hypothetical protein
MGGYTDVDGTPFSDAYIEVWASVGESEQGYTGEHLGLSVPGRPVSDDYSDAEHDAGVPSKRDQRSGGRIQKCQ